MKKEHKPHLKVINVMKDGRELETLEGVEAPEIIYDIVLRDYKAKGIKLIPVDTYAQTQNKRNDSKTNR